MDTDSVCGCPLLQRNDGAVAARNLAANRSEETPVQAHTRRARNQESMVSSLSEETARWQPEEKEISVCARRPSCPEGKRPRASELQIAEQVSVVFLLKLKSMISTLSILGQTFSWSREHMEANGGSTLLSRLVFRWTRDKERLATHYSEGTLWRAAADNSRNWTSKQSPEKRTHRSLSHEWWSTDDTDILFRGENTRTLEKLSSSFSVSSTLCSFGSRER